MARRENYQEGRSEGQNDPLNLGDEAARELLGLARTFGQPLGVRATTKERRACATLGLGLYRRTSEAADR